MSAHDEKRTFFYLFGKKRKFLDEKTAVLGKALWVPHKYPSRARKSPIILGHFVLKFSQAKCPKREGPLMRIVSAIALLGLLVSCSSGASPARPTPNAAPAAASPSDIVYVRYEDPAEKAFTDQVPSGWKVGGRMVRYGPVTIAPFVQAMPADGSIFVQLGDWHIQDFSDIPGWRQGQIYTPGTSVIIVRRLESADQYAHSFSLAFQKLLGCGNPEFAESESVANPTGPSRLPQGKTETRIAHFTCQRSGQHYVGRAMVSVQSVRLPMSVGWNVVYEASFIAREDRAAAALAVWDKMRTLVLI